MNHLVVFAHPNQNSLGKGIVDIVVSTSKEKGADVRVRDLYELGFDPILKAEDFSDFQSGIIPEDIAVEQEHIKWADLITFVYPVWWSSLPAMLKGYVDRIFSYEYVDGSPVGLLKNKKALLLSTTGTPSEIYYAIGMHDSIRQTTDQGIFNFTGIEEANHAFFGGVTSADNETIKNYLREIEDIVKKSL